MNLFEKVKLLMKANEFIKENAMLQKILSGLEGKKTYLFTIAWATYKIGITQGWWAESLSLETLLIGGGAASMREAVSKAK